ncbi:DUF4041 domain-containing protein [Nocardia sp. CA2R105]|uniref:DUF4041 domain-containing protein n=1 Tax=Nocardia coffeae TaxID=2873381 RepID=UPI001CA73D4F|nr:DUF4041 domain-containing protein [Nocardia coffeae]MBY8863891.1 DUF4041 domain-containing protein [Nocardia coffeae]
MSSAPANWYPDPQNPGFLRYWNGVDWTGDPVPASVADVPRQAPPSAPVSAKVPMFGTRGYAKRQSQDLAEALAEIQRLRAELAGFGGLEVAELQRYHEQLAAQVTAEQARLESVRREVINTQEEQVLQEVGIYRYRHPLSDVVAYRAALDQLQGEIKYAAARDGGAIEASQSWEVSGSVAQGRKMMREYSKLMLRAYNTEADNLVRSLKPYKIDTALQRLDRLATTIERLGDTMKMRITPWYHQLRRRELELTADYLEKLARQKEAERDERDRLREEHKAQQEIEREQQKLEKQHQQYASAFAALEATGNPDSPQGRDLQDKLADLEQKRTALADRAGNLRVGHVYVVSNIGAFGEDMVQIGMTRRLDPDGRISDLNNSSVPFKYDVHAMHFALDAAGIEEELHRRLAHKRVNLVNSRREFFRASPAEVREHLQELAGELLAFTEFPEAEDYRRSLAAARHTNQQ